MNSLENRLNLIPGEALEIITLKNLNYDAGS